MGVTKKQVASSKQTVVKGSIGGLIKISMPFQGEHYKRVLINIQGLNGTASYTFPTPFNTNNGIPPEQYGTGAALISFCDEISVTLTGVGPASSGWAIIEGN